MDERLKGDEPRDCLRHLSVAARRELEHDLLNAIRARLPELTALLEEVTSHWHGEDGFYRFYHQSWKVYGLQQDTRDIVGALRSLAPNRPMNAWFEQIVREGTGKVFQRAHNQRWVERRGPFWKRSFTPERCWSSLCATGVSWKSRRSHCPAAGPLSCTSTICAEQSPQTAREGPSHVAILTFSIIPGDLGGRLSLRGAGGRHGTVDACGADLHSFRSLDCRSRRLVRQRPQSGVRHRDGGLRLCAIFFPSGRTQLKGYLALRHAARLGL